MPDLTNEEMKERLRRRIRAAVDPERYVCTQAQQIDKHTEQDEYQHIAIYARISTIGQWPESPCCSHVAENNMQDEMEEDGGHDRNDQ